MAAESTVRIIFLGDASRAVRSVSVLEGGFSSLARTAKLAVAGIGIGMVGALAAATKQAVGFDRSMRNVNSIAHLSEKQFQALSKQVLGLAKDTGQGPKTLADGLYDIVSSGFKANDAVTILRASAKAATAGLTDTATSTKAVVAVLNAYHLSASKATEVSNTLFQEVNLGVNTFEELAQNIGDTAPQAAALKIPFSDVAAALATITLHGTSMAEASTQVSRVLTSLVKPTSAMKEEFKSMGYETGQAAIQALGFSGFIRRLSNDAGGNQAKLASWLGDIRGIRGVLNLTGKNLESFTGNVRKMGDAQKGAGATQRAFAEQAKSIAFQWQRAKAALAAAAIPIGQLLFPALSKAATALGNFAGWLTKINNAPDLSAKLSVIGSGFSGLASDVENSVKRILNGWDEVVSARKGAAGQTTAIHHLGLGEQIQQDLSQVDWGSVGAKILNGLIAGIKGGAALGAALVETVSRALAGINWTRVGIALGPALAGMLVSAFATLTDPGFWINHWQLALSVAVVAFGGVIGRFAGRFAGYFVRLGGDAVLALGERLPSALQGVFVDAVVLAGRALRGIVTHVRNVISDVIGFLNPFGARMTRLLTFVLKVTGVDAAIRAIEGWASSAISSANRVAHVISTAVGGAFQHIWGWLHRAWNWIIHLSIPIPDVKFKTFHGLPYPSVSVHWQSFDKGGFVQGQGDGAPVMVLAHAGEMILNKAQQQALGGAAALAQMFGFKGGNGLSFASGGIVPPGAHGRGSHTVPNRGGTAKKLQAVTAAGVAAFRAVDAVQQRETDLQSAYDLLGRSFQIEQTYHPVILTDAQGNQTIDSAELSKQLGEIDGLIASRQKMLALVAQEKARLQDAVAALKTAIAALVKAIREAREAAANEENQIVSLTREIASINQQETAESKRYSDSLSTGKKLSVAQHAEMRREHNATMYGLRQRKLSAQSRINTLRRTRQGHLNQASAWTSTLGGVRSDLATAQQSLFHDVDFRAGGYRLDLVDLAGQRSQLAATAIAPPGGAGPAGGGGAGPDVGGAPLGGAIASGDGGAAAAALAAALQTIAQLRLALGVQAVQAPVLGSFKTGTLHVPATGLYELHGGETVVPAGRTVRSGGDTHPPVVVQIHESGDIGGVIDRRIVANTPRISVMQGQSAERLRREGRF